MTSGTEEHNEKINFTVPCNLEDGSCRSTGNLLTFLTSEVILLKSNIPPPPKNIQFSV